MARRTARGGMATDDPTATRRTAPRRGRATAAVGTGVLMVARLVRSVAGLIALLIVVAIVLRLLGANAGNTIVKDVHDAAKFFVGPFDGMFSIHKAKLAQAVNWGIAAVVYVVVGGLIAGLIARLAPTGYSRGAAVD